MSAGLAAGVISEPCVIDGMSDEEYQRDPIPGGSLSSTGVKWLLPPSCPAKYRHLLSQPVVKKEFDLGHAVHKTVLGQGKDFVVTDFDNWMTKASKTERDAIRADGKTPLLVEDGRRVEAMAGALFRHPDAASLLAPDSGRPEQSLFWQDRYGTDVWLRARVDWLRHQQPGKRLILVDLKTARSAHPDEFARATWNFGYAIQAAFYSNGAKAVGLDDDPVFAFVVIEVEPPHLVNVITLDANALRIGNILIRQAIDLFHECRGNDHWPAYSDGVDVVSLPPYIERLFEDDTR